MTVLLVQRPCNEVVHEVHLDSRLLCYVSHDRVHGLALVVSLLALDNVLCRNSTLGEINVTCEDDLVSHLSTVSSPYPPVPSDHPLARQGTPPPPYNARDSPFSLSTRITTTTSFLPTRINFWILLIRRRESSESRIIPSMLSYSSCSTKRKRGASAPHPTRPLVSPLPLQ